VGVSRGSTIFFGIPYYLRNGKSYSFQIWPVYSDSPSQQNPIKIVEKRERGRIPRSLVVPPKMPNRKSYSFQICPVHSEGPSEWTHEKCWRKESVGVSRDCPIFRGTPYYLKNGKSYGFQICPVHLEGPSEQKTIKNFSEKGARAYPWTVQFFRVPPLISNSCMHIYRLNRNKSQSIKNFGISSRGRSQGLPEIFSASIHMAHRAVIFAMAQLSCNMSTYLFTVSICVTWPRLLTVFVASCVVDRNVVT